MCHDNEEWRKIWRGIDLSIQNWHEKFYEFWVEHCKISEIWTLISCFWLKYITFELKKVQRNYFRCTADWCKIWRKTDFYFLKWHDKFGKFTPEHVWKSKILNFYWILLSKIENVWAQNLQRRCVMRIKNGAKFYEDLTCQFKIDMRNLLNFDLSTRKSQKFEL